MEIGRLFGLPAHPLIVHAVVVLVPLCALGVAVTDRRGVGSVGLEVFDVLKEIVRECFLLARLAADEFELYKRLAWGAVDGEATCQYSSHRPVLDQQPEA
jgi:hypothetical protein